jgi:hypothetical protein
MTDEQIDKMLQMHRYLMKCEIKYAFNVFCAENGNEDYDYRAADRQEAFNDTKWEEFAEWLKMIRDK